MTNPKVYLVGAGPGDPGLITVKAVRLLERVDVVLYDYLVHPTLLRHCRSDAILRCVGKRKGYHSKKQAQINQLLRYYHLQGKTVVRLKGGDPFVFGRGSEELLYLKRHGISFEVVSGVSSAVAVPAYAGIPVTHRQLSRSFAVVTGTTKDPDFKKTHIPDADTLVVLMGVHYLEMLVERILENPRFNSGTPAALIYWGTVAAQRTLIGTLGTIVQVRDKEKVLPPTILVVGNVVSLAPVLDWVGELPLFGRRIFVLRAAEQAEELVSELEALGAEVFCMPMLAYKPISRNLRKLSMSYLSRFQRLIFTSANGVKFFMEQLLAHQMDARILAGKKITAVGPKTADRLRQFGIVADEVPAPHHADGIFDMLWDKVQGESILIPGSALSREALSIQLKSVGASVTALPIYQTVPPKCSVYSVKDGDYVIFTSPSTVTHFLDSKMATDKKITCFAIGHVTTEKIHEMIQTRVITATDATTAALVDAIISYTTDHPNS